MTYFSDMSKCLPQSALSKEARQNHWRLIEYESDEVSGKMISAGPMTCAPDVTYPLDVKGWHAIYVGYWNPYFVAPFGGRVEVKIKLKSDPCFITIGDNEIEDLSATSLREVFWKYADLTSEELTIGQQNKGQIQCAFLAYIKLEPLTDEQIRHIKAQQARQDTKIVISSNDGASWNQTKAPTTKEDILEQVEIYRNSDVGRIDWAVCYGEMTNYPSKVGFNYYADVNRDFITQTFKNECESLNTLNSRGLVPYKIAMEHAHSIGLEFHIMFRMGIGSYPPPMDSMGGLFAARSDLRIVARDGTPLPKLSYAFTEVREHMLNIIREVVDDQVDGINLCWIRGAPYVGYEEPVAKAFREQFGRDIKSVADDDEQLCCLRASYLTEFMREVRKITDEIGEKRGRKLTVTAMTTGTLSQEIYCGWDTKTWVQEKLVDAMAASAIYTRYFQANGVRHFLCFGPKPTEPPSQYFELAVLRAETGSDGFFVWDLNSVQELSSHWSVLRQFGHHEKIIESKGKISAVKKIKLKSVGTMDVEHTYNWGAGQALIFYTNG